MYRIVKETNRLTDKVNYIIERKKTFLWMSSWTRELGLDIHQRGPIGAPTYDGAKWKMQEIIAWDGRMIKKEIV
tara:strand:+ start:3255 stop:3476 length:222 start_codon:yes stop_codon:yes gene_type:complete